MSSVEYSLVLACDQALLLTGQGAIERERRRAWETSQQAVI